MADLYTYTYRPGGEADGELMIRDGGPDDTCAVVCAPDPLEIWPGDLPRIIEALYRAAGLPAPILLDRPAVSLDEGVAFCDGMVGASRYGNRIHFQSLGGKHEAPHAEVLDAVAKLAAFADLVAAEPDEAEVERLAAVIHAHRFPLGEADPDDSDRDEARAILRRYEVRERGHA